MSILQLIKALLPFVTEILDAIAAAQNGGAKGIAIHDAIVDHVAVLPGKIRSLAA